jgi:hypothetical protein
MLPFWRRFINKPASEIATDFGFFLLGVAFLYGIDLTLISRGAPVAVQYLVQFLLYMNHHAAGAVEVLY